MCQQSCHGIPIQDPTFRQYSEKLQNAWTVLDSWVKDKQRQNLDLSKKEMPLEVKEAYDLINETPIPGFEPYTGDSSCYILTLNENFID